MNESAKKYIVVAATAATLFAGAAAVDNANEKNKQGCKYTLVDQITKEVRCLDDEVVAKTRDRKVLNKKHPGDNVQFSAPLDEGDFTGDGGQETIDRYNEGREDLEIILEEEIISTSTRNTKREK